MPVDVLTEIEIDLARDEVAAYAADPDHATVWYDKIEATEWLSPPRIAFTASFLGRRLTYTYEVRELIPDERLVMRTAEGPFPMETTYTWAETPTVGARDAELATNGSSSGVADWRCRVRETVPESRIPLIPSASPAMSLAARESASGALEGVRAGVAYWSWADVHDRAR